MRTRAIKTPKVTSFVNEQGRALAEAEYLLLLEAEVYKRAEENLATMIRGIWPLLEPGRGYKHNWSVDCLCDHLTAVAMGHIQNLLINISPRTMKSITIDIGFPVWVWIQNRLNPDGSPKYPLMGPHVRFLTGAHTADLAIRDAVSSRRIMDSPWFKAAWSNRFKLTSDQNQKSRYENDKRGFRISFGTKTGVTGEGADYIILDDPHTVVEGMFSDVERKKVKDTWDQQIYNRLNDATPGKGARIVVMQRLHLDDLSGHILKQGNWVHLKLPMEYNPKTRCFIKETGWSDPRTKPGQLLWAERFTADMIAAEKKRLGPVGYAAQHDQEPVPMGGGIVPVGDFRRFKLPQSNLVEWAHQTFTTIVQFWDTASKAKELNDPWAGGTWGLMANGHRYLLEVYRARMTYPVGKQAVRDWHQKWKPSAVVIEDKSTGQSLLQELPNPPKHEKVQAVPCIPFEPDADKVTRMATEAPAITGGLVFIPEEADWIFDYIQECQRFPDSPTLDQVDMTSMALKHFRMLETSVPLVAPGSATSPSYWSV